MAQKLAEEATEVVIEAVRGERSAVINEKLPKEDGVSSTSPGGP